MLTFVNASIRKRMEGSFAVNSSHQSQSIRARKVSVPSTDLLNRALPRIDWSDAFAVPIVNATRDPELCAAAVFGATSWWVTALMNLRQALVRFVGIERAGESPFDSMLRNEHEVLLGIDQSHPNFRGSVLCEENRVVLSTIVQVHNVRGRIYSAVIRVVHPVIVRNMLNRARGVLEKPQALVRL